LQKNFVTGKGTQRGRGVVLAREREEKRIPFYDSPGEEKWVPHDEERKKNSSWGKLTF